MFDTALIVFSIAGTVFGVFVGIRTLFKKPRIDFSLDKTIVTLYNGKKEQKVALLIAQIANKRKRVLGDVAKGITSCVLYRAPIEDDYIGLNSSIGLPWLENFKSRTRVSGNLDTQEEIVNALENCLFERKESDLPQGRARGLAVVYGLESTNKLFLASNPAIEIPLPPKDIDPKAVFSACFFRLEIAGENLPSTQSEGSVIIANSWSTWTFPERVETTHSTDKFENFLLGIGRGRKTKVIKGKSRTKK